MLKRLAIALAFIGLAVSLALADSQQTATVERATNSAIETCFTQDQSADHFRQCVQRALRDRDIALKVISDGK